jgi:hypothetical protein
MYKIKIEYKTGNSFGSHDETDYLELEFKDLKVAEENIIRIKNHYEYYQKHSDMWHKPKGKLPKGVVWNERYGAILLETIDDDGNIFTENPFWVGYFETLYGASIVFKGMRYEP